MNNQWLNDLQRKMEDHEEDIPDGLWEDIKDELFSDEENALLGTVMPGNEDEKPKELILPSKGKSAFYRIAGIAAAIVILFFTGKLLLNFNGEKNTSHITKKTDNSDSSKETDRNVSELPKSDASEDEQIKTDEDKQYGSLGNILTERSCINEIIKDPLNKQAKDGKLIMELGIKPSGLMFLAERNLSDHISFPVNINPVSADKSPLEEVLNDKENRLSEKYADNNKAKIPGRQSKKWMLSMLTGNVSSNASDQKFPGYASISGSPMTFSDMWISGTDPDPLTEVLLANQSKEVEARIRHKIPVTFGLSMYYNLGKRWGIGTGINYTKLTSELHSGSTSNYIKGEQSIHYIGIPVQVNYNVIQKGRFTGYVTGGVLAEKAVAGKLRTKYIVNDEVQDTQEEKLDVKPVQFSVNSAVGLQVKIIDKIGIYAEPGIGYHFKNNSELNTIYKEKPLNFNMKFGIRLLLD
ncbi:porin family protein [Chryseobacterium sp. W4I1]|uniref:porin family protein n=1 Tax=Chryseobacterium sp. W4I1 TaxID=3042293 RepID=UPI002782BC3A|nr:porin family protein [Chryseobacterium sp. W4I1]MDQ0783953.1 hypothetical protein [Chryseobacterium sp. W4I1]